MNGACSHPTCPVPPRKIKRVQVWSWVRIKKHLPLEMQKSQKEPWTEESHAALPFPTEDDSLSHGRDLFWHPLEISQAIWPGLGLHLRSRHRPSISCVKSIIISQVPTPPPREAVCRRNSASVQKMGWGWSGGKKKTKPRGKTCPLLEEALQRDGWASTLIRGTQPWWRPLLGPDRLYTLPCFSHPQLMLAVSSPLF